MSAKKGNKYALNNKGGRPTKFTPEVLELAKQYIESCEDTIENGRLRVSLPTVEGLARWLNVSRDTCYAYGEANEEFSDTLENIKSEQAKRLIDNGLSGAYNPTIAKLMLSAKHGFVEKSGTDITSGGDKLQGVIILPRKDGSTLETTTEAGTGSDK